MNSMSLILALTLVSQSNVEYDCQAEKQIVVQSDNGKWIYSAGDVAKESRETFRYKFIVAEAEDGTMIVSHDSGTLDALGLGGSYEATRIAPGQFAFASQQARNCLFTELACGALVEISDISAKKASFSLTPMGSVKMEDGRREILQLMMLGTCKKSKS